MSRGDKATAAVAVLSVSALFSVFAVAGYAIGRSDVAHSCARLCATRGMSMRFKCEHPDMFACMCTDRNAP